MSVEILAVQSQRRFIRGNGAPQELVARLHFVFLLRPSEQRVAEFRQHDVVAGKVEAALRGLILRIHDLLEGGDRGVEMTVLRVDQPGKPGQRPPRRRRLGGPRLVERFLSIANNDDAATAHLVAHGECVQFTHSWPFAAAIGEFGTSLQAIEIQ